jgi:hypothetical protein
MIRVHDVGWGTVNQAVQDHADRLIRNSRAKPSYFIQETAAMSASPAPGDVAQLLNEAGVDFVIIGAHAIAVFTKESRATKDVDVIVDDVPKAVAALRSLKSRTRVIDLGAKVGKRVATANGGELVDVLSSDDGVRGVIFKHRTRITIDGERASIPTLPAMVALKWIAMFSPSRDPLKQAQDRVDLLRILKVHPDANIDAAAKLVAIASTMLARQLIYDMQQYRKTGDIRLFGEGQHKPR